MNQASTLIASRVCCQCQARISRRADIPSSGLAAGGDVIEIAPAGKPDC